MATPRPNQTTDTTGDGVTSAADNLSHQSDSNVDPPLRDQVSELIAPYRSSKEKPPFTTRELIAITLVINDDDSLEEDAILRWIVESFPYYSNKAINEYLIQIYYQHYEGYCTLSQVVKGFHDALAAFDLPIRRNAEFTDEFEITTSAARVALRRWLEPERTGTFRFLDLPPELRNRVYEMLFKYPRSGIGTDTVRRPHDQIRLCLLSREDVDIDNKKWHEVNDEVIFPEPVGITLSPLRTCKQIFQEAMPMFYSLNSFYFNETDHLSDTLQRLSISRARHLKTIHIKIPYPEHLTEDAFSQLCGLSLDVLVYWMEKSRYEDWLHEFARRRDQTKWDECRGFKGKFRLMVAAAKKAKHFEIRGDCPEFKAFMESKMKGKEKTKGKGNVRAKKA